MFLFFLYINYAKVYFRKNSFDKWKKDEVIYGHVGLCASGLRQHDIFLGFLKRNDPKMKGFGLRPKDESISTPGAKFQ
jgi:hypothetical protein